MGENAARTGFSTSKQPDFQRRDVVPYRTLTYGQVGVYPQIILLGDSITQQSSLTVQSRLQTLYIRRADIVNRGYSGYTASLALASLPYFLPTHNLDQPLSQAPIRLLTVFFGANDACVPGNFQHAPLSSFKSALRRIIEYPIFSEHGTKIILITPAPVDEWQLEKPLTRTATNAKQYAEGVRQLANEINLPCVDLWTAFMKVAGYIPETPEETMLPGSLGAPRNNVLSTLLHDGLHFAQRGYDIMSDELMATIQSKVPECMPENMPYVFRDWKEIRDENSEAPIPSDPENDQDIELPPQMNSKDRELVKSGTISEDSAEGPEKKKVKQTMEDGDE